MKNLTLICCVFLAFAVSVNAIRWVKSEDGTRYMRSLRIITRNSNTFEVRGVRKELGSRNLDAIDFLFSSKVVPRFVLRYFNSDEDSKEFFLHRWSLWKVFEYEESGDAEGFDPAYDNITSSHSLFNKKFDAMSYHTEEIEGGTLHYVCTDFTNQTTPFPNVRLCAHVTEQETVANASRVSPNSLKWSITISNYPYTVANGRLGLKVSFDSKSIVRDLSETDAALENEEGEAALDLNSDDGNGSPRGIASWVTTVDVSGTGCAATSDVVRTVVYDNQVGRDTDNFPNLPETSAELKLRVSYFSFPTNCVQPDSITWDPELGVSLDDSSSASSLSAIFSLVVLAAIFLML